MVKILNVYNIYTYTKIPFISTEEKSTKHIQEVMISKELSKVILRFLCFLQILGLQ